MRRAHLLAWPGFACILVAGCIHIDFDTGDVTCTELRNTYAATIAQFCSEQDAANGPGPSAFCSVCVAAQLYDYKTAPNGQCTCTQLVLSDTNCAATLDDQAILTGIKGAGMECVSFSAGADAAAPADASVTGVPESAAPTVDAAVIETAAPLPSMDGEAPDSAAPDAADATPD